MARKSRQDSIYRVSEHRIGAYSYAATHPYTLDADGRRRYRVLHWGTLGAGRRFIPGKTYLNASAEERSRLVFPPDWDLSALQAVHAAETGNRTVPFDPADAGKSYGAVWLLERIADRLGIRSDLEKALGGDRQRVNELLTLAFFPLLTGTHYGRFLPWSEQNKLPSDSLRDERHIDACLAAVTPEQFQRFMDLRRLHTRHKEFCAVDSVSRVSSGGFAADRKWGQKAERIHLQSQFDAAVYCVHGHLPVYYRPFPCAVSDSRGISILCSELSQAGFDRPLVVTDRGYDHLHSLDRYISDGVPMVMCVDSKQDFVAARIRQLDFSGGRPLQMEQDTRNARCFRQYPMEGEWAGCRLNLYFNPLRRAAELSQIETELSAQRSALEEMMRYGLQVEDKRSARRSYYLFHLRFDAGGRNILGFDPDAKTLSELRTGAGFYANVTSGAEMDALASADLYSLKYDQEKFFRRFRPLMDLPRQAAGPDQARYGITLVQFLMLILDTRLRQVHQHSDLRHRFRDVQAVTDLMHRVPCMRDADGNCVPGPFDADQREICRAFALEEG